MRSWRERGVDWVRARAGALAAALRCRAVELFVMLAVLANSAAYLVVSENLIGGSGSFAIDAYCASEQISERGWLSWVRQQRYYPPLYVAWLTLQGPIGGLQAPTRIVLWSDLLLLLGLFGTAAALRRLGAGTGTVGLAMMLAAGFPLVNVYTKLPAYECGLVGAVGLLLWLAVASTPVAIGSAALGIVLAAGLLFKWTFVLYAAGPVLALGLRSLRTEGWARAARRLTLAATVAAAVAGPWYYGCLDWELLGRTTSNDATFPGLRGWELYRAAARDYLLQVWPLSMGSLLLPFVLAGAALAALRRCPGTWLLLSTALLPALALPSFVHLEARYLLPALPGLAAAAGLGLGSLGGRWKSGLLLGVALCSLCQAGQRTWGHFGRPQPRLEIGPHGAFDGVDLGFTWGFSARPARAILDRCIEVGRQLDLPPEELRLAVHPLNPNPVLDLEAFYYLVIVAQDSSSRFMATGYNWSEYLRFLSELESGRFTFLIVPRGMSSASPAMLRYWAGNAASYVQQRGESNGAIPAGERPADPFATREIDRGYGLLPGGDSPETGAWLLVRRDLWARERARNPALPALGRLPPLQ